MEYQFGPTNVKKEKLIAEVLGERPIKPEPDHFAYREWKLYSGYPVNCIEALFYAHLYL
jgi:hypothetical protein